MKTKSLGMKLYRVKQFANCGAGTPQTSTFRAGTGIFGCTKPGPPPKCGMAGKGIMTSIPVAAMEFVEGGRAIWIHNRQGGTVLRIQCTGKVQIHKGCANICAHADINVNGSIEICIPNVKPKRK